MARNKQSSFNATEGLDFNTQQVQYIQQIAPVITHEVQEVQQVQKEIGTTQGKKGQKLKRINMAFSDINHDYISKESRRNGISCTAFVNQIIDEYRNAQQVQ